MQIMQIRQKRPWERQNAVVRIRQIMQIRQREVKPNGYGVATGWRRADGGRDDQGPTSYA